MIDQAQKINYKIPGNYAECVGELRKLVAVADSRRLPTFTECQEYEMIRMIGKQPDSLGGLKLMRQAHAEVRQSGICFNQDWWDKIGNWWA